MVIRDIETKSRLEPEADSSEKKTPIINSWVQKGEGIVPGYKLASSD